MSLSPCDLKHAAFHADQGKFCLQEKKKQACACASRASLRRGTGSTRGEASPAGTHTPADQRQRKPDCQGCQESLWYQIHSDFKAAQSDYPKGM